MAFDYNTIHCEFKQEMLPRARNLLLEGSILRVFFKSHFWGSLGGTAVWRLPLAQGAILETQDRIPRRAPGAWSLLLPLPVSLPLSLSVTIINK